MKITNVFAVALGISSFATLTSMAGPIISVQIPAPAVVVQTPAPPVVVETAVPDTYVWDGFEFVGVVGTQYYYLGPNHVWLTFDGPRLARFHEWEKVHGDWRAHAIRNELYRRDAHGHEVPFHDDHGHAAPVHDDHHAAPVHDDHGHDAQVSGHDSDNHHDADKHDRDQDH